MKSAPGRGLPRALTTPNDTVGPPWSPRVFPMARASCPTLSCSESPSVAAGRFSASTWMTAMSVDGSLPTTSPTKERPSLRCIWTLAALSMLTTLSLSLSTAPVIWLSSDVSIDMVLEPPARLSDWFDPDVQIVSLLSRFCFSSYFDSSRNPSGGGVNVVYEQSYSASWRYVLKSFTILKVPTTKVEVRTV